MFYSNIFSTILVITLSFPNENRLMGYKKYTYIINMFFNLKVLYIIRVCMKKNTQNRNRYNLVFWHQIMKQYIQNQRLIKRNETTF